MANIEQRASLPSLHQAGPALQQTGEGGSSPVRGGHRLTLLVQESEPGIYRFLLDSADRARGPNNESYGPLRLRRDPREFLNTFFEGIAELPSTTPEVAQRQLESRGVELFRQLFPPELRRRLWALRHGTQTLQIQSEEPWIPWELCKLEGEEGSRRLPGLFLCEAFAVTRFLPHYSQPTRLPLERIAAITTGDLPQADTELTELRALAAGRHVIDPLPAEYMQIVEALTAGRYDGWHFIGHGRFDPGDPNRSAILLNEYQTLTPEDVSSAGDFGQRQPLVFWNACSTGRADFTLAGVGGWAKAFLEAGAGAFLGSFWPIPDDPARRFALAFYRHFLAGTPFAEAVRAARLEIRNPGDPTWLAYTVYANPVASCLAGEGEGARSSPSPVPPPAKDSAAERQPAGIPIRKRALSPRALVGWAAAAWTLFLLGGCGSGALARAIWELLPESSELGHLFNFYLLLIATPATLRAATFCDQHLRDHLDKAQRYLAIILSYFTGIFAAIVLS